MRFLFRAETLLFGVIFLFGLSVTSFGSAPLYKKKIAYAPVATPDPLVTQVIPTTGPLPTSPVLPTTLPTGIPSAVPSIFSSPTIIIPSITPSRTPTPIPIVPITIVPPSFSCPSSSSQQYDTIDIDSKTTSDRPSYQHADLNLALRGYMLTNASLDLVDYGGDTDPKAPQLDSILGTGKPVFTNTYQVFNWDWSKNAPANTVVTDFPVTLLGLKTNPGQIVRIAQSGYSIAPGTEVVVLFASERSITVKYTREGNVVGGYALHLEGLCVDPNLLNKFRSEPDKPGRIKFPSIKKGQPVGIADGTELRVGVRDSGAYMDPRTRKDWWKGY